MATPLFPPISLDTIRARLGESRRRLADLARELGEARRELVTAAGAAPEAVEPETGEGPFDEGPTKGDISEGELKFEALDLFVTERTKS